MEEYLLWIKIHAHISQIILFRSGRSGSGIRALSPEGHLLGLFTHMLSGSEGLI